MTDEKPDNEEWAARLGEQLRRQEADLPPHVTQQLAQHRRAAVAAADTGGRTPGVWSWWAGAGAAAATVLAVGILLQSPVQQLPVADDLDLVVAQDVELLEELEFVAWMVAMEDESPYPPSG